MTKIQTCDCVHEYQDAKYGKGNRVHNKAVGKGSGPAWICTVCGKRKE